MKISKSKQELARIISENGGWKSDKCFAAQDACGTVNVYECKPIFISGNSGFGHGGGWFTKMFKEKKIANWHQTILSREEYFHLYPAPDADGWIEWRGGDASPVAKGAAVDVKMKNGTEHFGQLLSDACWHDSWGEASVIAYRLHKPEQAKPQSPVEMAFDIIQKGVKTETKPTIEQLAAEYRNRKDCADRKQAEADAAKSDAEAKLAELVAAGKALNLAISVSNVEPELVITDWRDLKVDDVISVQCFEKVYSQSTVLAVGVSDVQIRNHVGARKTVNLDERDWSFIRRP